MKFVLIHGAFGSPEGNWFPELKEKLEALGQEVIVPQFPVEDWEEINKKGPKVPPKNQSLSSWFNTFARSHLASQGETLKKYCFVGHSLGCLFILHIVDKYNLKLDSAIFVSPFMRKLDIWQFDLVNETFYKTDFDFEKLKRLIPISYVLYSPDDPYVNQKHPKEFAQKMKSSIITISNGGHLNDEAGFINLPIVTELCKTRLNPQDCHQNLQYRQRYRKLSQKARLIFFFFIGLLVFIGLLGYFLFPLAF